MKECEWKELPKSFVATAFPVNFQIHEVLLLVCLQFNSIRTSQKKFDYLTAD